MSGEGKEEKSPKDLDPKNPEERDKFWDLLIKLGKTLKPNSK